MSYFRLALTFFLHDRGIRTCLIAAVLVALANILALAPATAQGPKCTFTMSNISFGPIDVSTGKSYDATATFTYACTGDAREIIRICPSYGVPEGSSRWITDSSGHKLMYNIYTDPERATIWGTWHSKSTKGPSIDIPVGRGERVSGSVTAYARTDPDQQSVPPGSYSGSINGNNTAIVYGYTSAGSCESLKNGPKDHLGFSITANLRAGGTGNAQGSTQNHTEPPARVDYTNDSRGRSSRDDHRPADSKMETCSASSPGATLNGDNGWTGPNCIATDALGRPLPPEKQYQYRSVGDKPLCAIGQSGVTLNSDGGWTGPNCIATDSHGTPLHPEDQQPASDAGAKKSCQVTAGPVRANELVGQCLKVTTSTHSPCNGENSCQLIKDEIKRSCKALGADAPGFCDDYR